MAKQNPLKKLLGLAVFGAGGFLFVRGIIGQFPGLTPNQMLVSGLILITALRLTPPFYRI